MFSDTGKSFAVCKMSLLIVQSHRERHRDCYCGRGRSPSIEDYQWCCAECCHGRDFENVNLSQSWRLHVANECCRPALRTCILSLLCIVIIFCLTSWWLAGVPFFRYFCILCYTSMYAFVFSREFVWSCCSIAGHFSLYSRVCVFLHLSHDRTSCRDQLARSFTGRRDLICSVFTRVACEFACDGTASDVLLGFYTHTSKHFVNSLCGSDDVYVYFSSSFFNIFVALSHATVQRRHTLLVTCFSISPSVTCWNWLKINDRMIAVFTPR